MHINGRFWLTKESQNFLGAGRIHLLEWVDKTGSINAAAKAMKMSYKAAWERINRMNLLADFPLIERTTGGRGGGGTKLTPYAHELIATFYRLDELHRQFIDRFSQAGNDPQHLARILSRTFLTTSARNQLPTKLITIEYNGLHATLTLALSALDHLRSTITAKSVENMGLEIGCNAYAIIKSSDICIVTSPTQSEKNNLLAGTIIALEELEDQFEVTLQLKGGTSLITLTDTALSLQIGMRAYALISPLHIIIGL